KETYLRDMETKLKQREQDVAGKEDQIDARVTKRRELLEAAANEQKQALLRIGHLSEDDARREALKAVEQECQHDAALIIQRTVEKAEEEARTKAQEITLQAIQRYASEHAADSTVTAIAIPS